MNLSWLSFRSDSWSEVVAGTRSSRGQPARGTEGLTTRLPLLLHALGLLHQEVGERRQLEQLRLAFRRRIAQHIEALPGQVAQLLILRDVESPRFRRGEVSPDAVHPLARRSRATDGMQALQ